MQDFEMLCEICTGDGLDAGQEVCKACSGTGYQKKYWHRVIVQLKEELYHFKQRVITLTEGN